MGHERAAHILSRLILSGFVSVLAGRDGSDRTDMALAIAKAWEAKKVRTLYLYTGPRPLTNEQGLWVRHCPGVAYEEIATLYREYELKNKAAPEALIVDNWQQMFHGRRFGAYHDLKYSMLWLKLFAFERQLRTLIVETQHRNDLSPIRPRLLPSFISQEAKTTMVMHDSGEGGSQVTVWANYNRPWGPGFRISHKKP